MFTPYRFNIKKTLKADRNVVAVRFKPIYKSAEALEKKYGGNYSCLHAENCSCRPYVRKAQYSFGWDWGPTLATAGIWRSVQLIAYDKAKLGYLAALPLEVSVENAEVKLVADAYAPEPCNVNAKFVFEGFGLKIEKQVAKTVSAGQSSIECLIEVSNPRLWWPKGYGDPNLYDVSVELYFGEVLLDRATVKCGVRSVSLLQEPGDDGTSFTFVVNGVKVFCRGVDWVPADSFLPKVSAERYRQLLDLALKANVNMLRVWGGGVYEDTGRYELCDRLGVMVWQDFMYACSAYPQDEWFLNEAEREAKEVVGHLQGSLVHRCVVRQQRDSMATSGCLERNAEPFWAANI